MAVNLTLSSDQAALLLPLLQQLSSPGSGSPVESSQVLEHTPVNKLQSGVFSTPSSSRTESTIASSSPSSDFTTDDLLNKKKKNRKSTSAQGYLLVSPQV